MKNDLWKLLLINKNNCANVCSNPASTILQLESAIDTIQQVYDGFTYLVDLEDAQYKSELKSCLRIESDLNKSLSHLKKLGAKND
jgi:hypothetical protein